MTISQLFLNGVYNDDLMAGRPTTKEAPPFGNRLAAIRKAKSLSQEHFAQLMDTTRANIAYYERSAKNPTLEFIQRCADVLNVPISDLINDASKEPKRRHGPKSQLEERFERVAKLPRSKQKEILNVVDALLKQAS